MSEEFDRYRMEGYRVGVVEERARIVDLLRELETMFRDQVPYAEEDSWTAYEDANDEAANQIKHLITQLTDDPTERGE